MNTSKAQLQANQKFFQMLGDVFVQASSKRLSYIANRTDIRWRDLNEHDNHTRFRWALSICLNLDPAFIHFRCFFSTDSGMDLIQDVLDRPHDKITVDFYHSIFGEFCNLVGGAIQNSLLSTFTCLNPLAGEEMNSIGLPLKELIGQPSGFLQTQGEFEKVWALEWNYGIIICNFRIHIPHEKLEEITAEMSKQNIRVLEIDGALTDGPL